MMMMMEEKTEKKESGKFIKYPKICWSHVVTHTHTHVFIFDKNDQQTNNN